VPLTKKYYYTFLTRTRYVFFGPYETEDEAKTAFQRKYGYWPEDAIQSTESSRSF
jgi:hypothetical protein